MSVTVLFFLCFGWNKEWGENQKCSPQEISQIIQMDVSGLQNRLTLGVPGELNWMKEERGVK